MGWVRLTHIDGCGYGVGENAWALLWIDERGVQERRRIIRRIGFVASRLCAVELDSNVFIRIETIPCSQVSWNVFNNIWWASVTRVAWFYRLNGMRKIYQCNAYISICKPMRYRCSINRPTAHVLLRNTNYVLWYPYLARDANIRTRFQVTIVWFVSFSTCRNYLYYIDRKFGSYVNSVKYIPIFKSRSAKINDFKKWFCHNFLKCNSVVY